VPVGNVYHYYKSKDELVAAAIDSYAQEGRERLSWLEQQHRTPRARLKVIREGRRLEREGTATLRCGSPGRDSSGPPGVVRMRE